MLFTGASGRDRVVTEISETQNDIFTIFSVFTIWGSTSITNVYDENLFIFVCGYIIILLTQFAWKIIFNQANKGNINLFSLKSLDSNMDKMEVIYKTDNCVN